MKRHSTIRSRSTAADSTTLAPAAPTRRGRQPKAPAGATPAPSAAATDTEVAAVALSARTRTLIDKARDGFLGFVKTHSGFLLKREDIVGPFAKAWKAFKEETTLTLADFARQFDPSVPADRDGYRAHSTYRAAENLMALHRQLERAKQAKEAGTTASGPQRATPLDAVARMLKSVLPLISADQVDRLWETVTKELGWTEQQVTNLKNRTSEAEALLAVRPPRGFGGTVPQLRIATVRHTDESAAEEPRTGTHG